MSYEKEREELRRYLLQTDRLSRKCEEVQRWETMNLSSGSVIHAGGSTSRGPDTVRDIAIQLRQECEAQAVEVRRLRQELCAALARMPTAAYRSILEAKYIDGLSNKELQAREGYTDRHVRRLLTQAISELTRCGCYF